MSSRTVRRQILYRQLPVEYDVIGHPGVCPPVMLVHGFTEDRRIWEKIVPELAKKYQFILPDLPGSGGSPYNLLLDDLNGFAAALDAIREAEIAEKIILIGHSMGGYISMAYVEGFSRHLAGLGLFHSTARPDSEEKKTARMKNQDFIRRNGSGPFVRQALPGLYSNGFRASNPEEIDVQTDRYANFNPESLVLYLEVMRNRPDRTGLLRDSDVPVLIITGQEDKVVPPAEGLAQSHLARISYFHTLPRTAHMGMRENPTLCISILDRFLDQFTW